MLLLTGPRACGTAFLVGAGSVIAARRAGPDGFEYARFGGEEWPASDDGSLFFVAIGALHAARQLEEALRYDLPCEAAVGIDGSVRLTADQATDFVAEVLQSTGATSIGQLSRRLAEPSPWIKSDISRIGRRVASVAERTGPAALACQHLLGDAARGLARSVAMAVRWQHRRLQLDPRQRVRIAGGGPLWSASALYRSLATTEIATSLGLAEHMIEIDVVNDEQSRLEQLGDELTGLMELVQPGEGVDLALAAITTSQRSLDRGAVGSVLSSRVGDVPFALISL